MIEINIYRRYAKCQALFWLLYKRFVLGQYMYSGQASCNPSSL